MENKEVKEKGKNKETKSRKQQNKETNKKVSKI
jgi:hypothetical protein